MSLVVQQHVKQVAQLHFVIQQQIQVYAITEIILQLPVLLPQ